MSISLRLPTDVEERLTNLAKKTARTKTYYATEAIINYIDDLEDWYLAEKRLCDLKNGKSELITLEELMAENELEN